MKYIALVLALSSLSAFANRDLDNVDCIIRKAPMECRSSGYWSGENSTTCTQKIRVKMGDKSIKTIELRGSDYARTDTGMLKFLTLGATDAVMNQLNAAGARLGASQKIDNELSLLDMCDGSRNESQERQYSNPGSVNDPGYLP